MHGMIRQNKRTILRHLAVWLLAVALAAPAFAGPRSIVRVGRTSASNSALSALLHVSHDGSKTVAQIIGSDRDALISLNRMCRLLMRARPGDTDAIVARLGKAIAQLEGDIGEDNVRRLLRNFTNVEDWARANNNLEALQDTLLDMTHRGKGRYLGGWFELILAVDYAGPPPHLKNIQPKKAGDWKLFRDFLTRVGNIETYVEAKNWRKTSFSSGAKKLRAQVNSHFRRLRTPPTEAVIPVPPARKLQFIFNAHEAIPPPGDIPPAWRKSIEEQTYHALMTGHPAGFGLSPDAAKAWVANNLDITVVPVRPPSP